MKSRKEFLIDEIIDFLKENTEAMADLCGEDDEICYLSTKKILDYAIELKELLEVTA